MIKTFYFNDLRTCCYVLWDDTQEAVIIDPGCVSESEKDRLVKFIEQNELKPVKLINTHGHFDHVMGNAFVVEKWNLPTYMSVDDLPQLQRAMAYGAYFGLDFDEPSSDVIDIKEGDTISFGNSTLFAQKTPGHSEGGVVLYWESEKSLISGDSLFASSIGRTDLPGGDFDTLMESLNTKILLFPHDTKVYPGHGPATTIASELENNPFLK